MIGLEQKADEVVRDAVDAFIEGRRVVEHDGETLLETKNSRYRVLDGVLFSAPDPSLFGAEFVGWLCDNALRIEVDSSWSPGLRAVLVDRKRGRHIIITSTIVEVSGAPLHSIARDAEPSLPYALARRRDPAHEAAAEPPVAAQLLAAQPLAAQPLAAQPNAAFIPPFPPAPSRVSFSPPIPGASAGPFSAAMITGGTRPPPPPPRRAASPSPAPYPYARSPQADVRAPLHVRPATARPAAGPLPFPTPPPRRAPTPLPAAPVMPTWPEEPSTEEPSTDVRVAHAPAVSRAEELPLLASSDVLDLVDPDEIAPFDDDVEETEPTSPPFLLARPATIAPPPPPASQPGNEPFLLGRKVPSNAPLR